MKKEEIFESTAGYCKLINLSYKNIDNDVDVDKIEEKFKDKVTFVEKNDECATFKFERTMKFSPEALFEFKFVYLLEKEFIDDIDTEKVDFVKFLKDLDEEEKRSFFIEPISWSTILIGQISNVGAHMPLIIPPYFMK